MGMIDTIMESHINKNLNRTNLSLGGLSPKSKINATQFTDKFKPISAGRELDL